MDTPRTSGRQRKVMDYKAMNEGFESSFENQNTKQKPLANSTFSASSPGVPMSGTHPTPPSSVAASAKLPSSSSKASSSGVPISGNDSQQAAANVNVRNLTTKIYLGLKSPKKINALFDF